MEKFHRNDNNPSLSRVKSCDEQYVIIGEAGTVMVLQHSEVKHLSGDALADVIYCNIIQNKSVKSSFASS